MIKVTYSYICDWCDKPMRERQVFVVQPHHGMTYLQPEIALSMIGNAHVCPTCYDDAMRKLE